VRGGKKGKGGGERKKIFLKDGKGGKGAVVPLPFRGHGDGGGGSPAEVGKGEVP